MEGGIEGEYGEGKTFAKMGRLDYDAASMFRFNAGSNATGADIAGYAQMIPADGGTLVTFSMPRLSSNELNDAIISLIAGEIAGMKAAALHLFTREDKTNNLLVKPNAVAQQFYHKDKNGNLLVGGKPAGNAFKFQAFPELNGVSELFDEQGVIKTKGLSKSNRVF